MCIKMRGHLTIVVSDGTTPTALSHTLSLNGDFSWTPIEPALTEIYDQDGNFSATDAPLKGERSAGVFAFEAYQRTAGDDATLSLADIMNKSGGVYDPIVSTRGAASWTQSEKTLTWTATWDDDGVDVVWLMEGCTHTLSLAGTLSGNKISGSVAVRAFTATRP